MTLMLFQERLYEEISDVLRADDDVTMYDLDKLQYLDQVYKEILRWTLIVPFIARKATEDIKLSASYFKKKLTHWFDCRPRIHKSKLSNEILVTNVIPKLISTSNIDEYFRKR